MTGLARSLTVCGAVVGAVCVSPHQMRAQTVTTRVMIRVVANDAKIIGSGVGGARVTVVDLETGRVMVEGVQGGGTGNTRQIMQEPRRRHESVFDSPGAGGFLAELALARPTRVQIVAEGPLGTPQAVQRASTTMLLVPGQHIEGDGVVLVLHGFTVVLERPDSAGVAARAGNAFEVVATVTMLCGCPTEPDGLWDANDITIVARAMRGDQVVAEGTLEFAGRTSTYTTSLILPEAGHYDLEVLAMDAAHANFGRARTRIEIR